MKKTSLAALLAFVLAVGIHYDVYKRYHHDNLLLSLLYLPSSKFLGYVSFGYQPLVADAIYLWSIQYFADLASKPKMEYLGQTYSIITDLDPHYLDAYQTGALFMFFEGRNPEGGFALLDRGMANNPEEWILPADAGFYGMGLKDYNRASSYFDKASRIPEAPSMVKEMLAGMRYKAGDKRYAYQLWQEIYATAKRPSLKQVAYQHVHDLKVMLDVADLTDSVHRYHDLHGSNPLNLAQLSSTGIMKEIPTDPEGGPYLYDPGNGKVEYSRKLVLYNRYQ